MHKNYRTLLIGEDLQFSSPAISPQSLVTDLVQNLSSALSRSVKLSPTSRKWTSISCIPDVCLLMLGHVALKVQGHEGKRNVTLNNRTAEITANSTLRCPKVQQTITGTTTQAPGKEQEEHTRPRTHHPRKPAVPFFASRLLSPFRSTVYTVQDPIQMSNPPRVSSRPR